MKLRTILTAGAAAVATVATLSIPAVAHEAVPLDQSDTNPIVAPLALDGTDPVAFFGVLPRPHAVRSAQFNMRDGQQVDLALLVPDRAPENTLATSQLPKVYLFAPDETLTVLTATIRIPITTDDGISLLVLSAYSAPATAGTYSFLVTGQAPARFDVGIGQESEEFHGIERGTLATDEQIEDWYDTAP